MAAGASLGGFAGSLPAGAAVTDGIPGIEGQAMLNDVTKCIGCLSCAIACKKVNDLSDIFAYSDKIHGNTWTTIKFLEQKTKDNISSVNLKVQCMHCSQASCVAVCPTGAAYQRTDGIVLFDQATCIGCGYCVTACPFSVPGVSRESGTARKCTFCDSRLRDGKIPACAEACPAQAIEYGDYEELLAKAQGRIESLKSEGLEGAMLYGQKELGGLKVIYILPGVPEVAGLPDNPKLATGDSLVKWFAGLAMAGYLVASPLQKVFRDDAGSPADAESKGVDEDV